MHLIDYLVNRLHVWYADCVAYTVWTCMGDVVYELCVVLSVFVLTVMCIDDVVYMYSITHTCTGIQKRR